MKVRKRVRTKPRKTRARQMNVLEARVRKLERVIAALQERDEALDHSIEELAAAWVAEGDRGSH